MNSYTKGKWELELHDEENATVWFPNHSGSIEIFMNEGKVRANAQLIASAPDLYEALKEIRDLAVLEKKETGFYILRLQYSSWQDACKALAKAEGK